VFPDAEILTFKESENLVKTIDSTQLQNTLRLPASPCMTRIEVVDTFVKCR
jgi:hypothetical protein